MHFGPHSRAGALPIADAEYSGRCFRMLHSGLAWSRPVHGILRWMLIWSLSLAVSQAVCAAQTQKANGTNTAVISSQTPANIREKTYKKHVGHRIQRHPRGKTTPAPMVTPVPTPPAPVPPEQQAASPATVAFTQGHLRIDARNSSLVAILNQISRQTGLVVQGLDHDKRIYGQYGPGSVSGTLTTLLDGAGYDYVMIGGRGDGIPSKLLLTPGGVSPSSTEPIAPAAVPDSSAESPAMANPSEPPQQKTPQQIFDELRKMHPR